VLNLIGVVIISTLAMFLVSKASKGVDPDSSPDGIAEPAPVVEESRSEESPNVSESVPVG
jgi:hypothetical protein